MLSPTRLKVYLYAYTVRMKKGESMLSIDTDYLSNKELKKDEIEQIHRELRKSK